MRETELREALDAAKAELAEMKQVLEKLSQPPLEHSPILRVNKDTVTVFKNGAILDVPYLPELKGKLAVGDCGLLNTTMASIIVGAGAYLQIGGQATAARKLPDGRLDLGDRVVSVSPKVTDLEEGDKVVLDPSGSVVLSVLPRAKKAFEFEENTGVSWADIGGQPEAKRAFIEAIELPLTNPDLFTFYGKKAPSGIVAYGPPGCGKTMLGKATATSVAALSGKDRRSAFLYVKGPELLDPYVGVTEAMIRGLFERARVHYSKHGTKAVIFIDEADALLGARGRGWTTMEKTVVPQFLSEMDGLGTSAAIVILATNRIDQLDPAVIREGRMDRKIAVERPDEKAAADILKLHLRGVPLAVKADDVKNRLATEIAADVYDRQRRMFEVMTDDGGRTIHMSDLVSGAMLAGVIGTAQSLAMQDDLERGGKPRGVSLLHFQEAVDQVFVEAQAAHPVEVIADKVGNAKVTGIRKVEYAKAA